MKVVVGASTFAEAGDAALRLLEEKGIEVIKNPYRRKMTEDEIIKHLQGADGLLAGLEPINEKVLTLAPDLKAVARIGIGMDSVDMEACVRHGVKVSNTPDAPTDAVAEMTISALLSINRRIVSCNRDLHHGEWKKQLGVSMRGQRILVIGYGRIGKKVTALLRMLGADALIYDPFQPDVSIESIEETLRTVDVITLHAAGKETILTRERLEECKPGCVILNCARGAIIDETALYEGLQSGTIAWFWGDVFPEEPYKGKLIECENAVLTPHIASNTRECRLAMELEASENIIRDLGL